MKKMKYFAFTPEAGDHFTSLMMLLTDGIVEVTHRRPVSGEVVTQFFRILGGDEDHLYVHQSLARENAKFLSGGFIAWGDLYGVVYIGSGIDDYHDYLRAIGRL